MFLFKKTPWNRQSSLLAYHAQKNSDPWQTCSKELDQGLFYKVRACIRYFKKKEQKKVKYLKMSAKMYEISKYFEKEQVIN